MKRLIALMIVPLAPAALVAQQALRSPSVPSPTSDSLTVAATTASRPLASHALIAGTSVTTTAHPAPLAPLAPLAPGRRRRRGSMVGYIGDSEIQSKIQVRGDLGYHIDAPDRAEFFYGKCGCYRDLQGNPAYDPDAPGPGPGIVEDMNFKQLHVQGEYAFTQRLSAFAVVPFRSVQPQSFVGGAAGFGNESGIGDVQAGVKFALLRDAMNSVTLQLQGYFPTGDAARGLGTNHASVEPAVLLHRLATDRLSIEGQLGAWHPIGGSAGVPTTSSDKFAGDVLYYGIGPSYELYRSDNDITFAPVVELVGWRVLSGRQTGGTGDPTGTNIVNLKLGARIGWSEEDSFYIGYGRALTSASWYDSILRLEYRWSR